MNTVHDSTAKQILEVLIRHWPIFTFIALQTAAAIVAILIHD